MGGKPCDYSMSVGDAERVVRLVEMADSALAARLCITLNSECFSGEVSTAAGAWFDEIMAGAPITPTVGQEQKRWRVVEKARSPDEMENLKTLKVIA